MLDGYAPVLSYFTFYPSPEGPFIDSSLSPCWSHSCLAMKGNTAMAYFFEVDTSFEILKLFESFLKNDCSKDIFTFYRFFKSSLLDLVVSSIFHRLS